MRTSLKSFSFPIALVQLAGWLTVGLMFWLLLLTHDVVAAPHPTEHPATVERHRSQRHAEFWQTREAIRTGRTIRRTFFGRLLYPSAHQRAERARSTHRDPARAHYAHGHAKPGPATSLGPVLGAIFTRNQGR